MTVADATAYTVVHPAREGSRPLTAEVLWSIRASGAPSRRRTAALRSWT